ncbi:MAG TPA: mechanosensitive ion channel family protein [Xanthobacteraceae bacterium]
MELGEIQAAVTDTVTALSFLPGWAVATIVLVLTVVLASGVHAVLVRMARRAFARRSFLLSLVARAGGPVRLAFVVLAVVVVLPALPFDPAAKIWAVTALRAVFMILVGWVALVAVDIAATIYLLRFQGDVSDNLLARKHVTQVRILQRAAATLVVVITAGAVLMSFDAVRQIGVSLFASAGVAGIVAGLAARPLLSNLIAGIQIATTQPIRLDDLVVVENETGTIEEITSTYVVVKLWDLRRMILPLTYFIEKPFQNWTRESSELIGSVTIRADYGVPVDRLRNKLMEIVEASPLWDRRLAKLQMTDSGERSVELRALVSARSAADSSDLRCEVREKLIAFMWREYPRALPHEHGELATTESPPPIRQRDGGVPADAH